MGFGGVVGEAGFEQDVGLGKDEVRRVEREAHAAEGAEYRARLGVVTVPGVGEGIVGARVDKHGDDGWGGGTGGAHGVWPASASAGWLSLGAATSVGPGRSTRPRMLHNESARLRRPPRGREVRVPAACIGAGRTTAPVS